MLADLVDGHDVRMVELRGRFSASMRNRCNVSRRGKLPGQDHLEGDDALEPDLPGLEDNAHAAAGDLLDQLILSEHTRRLFPGAAGAEDGVPWNQVVGVGALPRNGESRRSN